MGECVSNAAAIEIDDAILLAARENDAAAKGILALGRIHPTLADVLRNNPVAGEEGEEGRMLPPRVHNPGRVPQSERHRARPVEARPAMIRLSGIKGGFIAGRNLLGSAAPNRALLLPANLRHG
jgi:hypothetical protein